MRAEVEGSTCSSTRSMIFLPDLAGLRVHMIGIGGSGMSGAAVLLRDLGANVSGSDMVPFPGIGDLVARGLRVSIGHSAAHVDDNVKLVVASAAIPQTNPEMQAARAQKLPILKYAELLGGLMGLREGVAIAGTHGKSTTSGMTAYLLQQAGLSPAFAIGARSEQLGGNSGVGTGKHFVVESCEFDRSFLRLYPKYAAILNVEPDHLDCYRDLDEIVGAFAEFAGNVESDGVLLCNAEDRCAMHAARSARARVETFGIGDAADWQAANLCEDRGCFSFDVLYDGESLGRTSLAIPGLFNVSNALASFALAHRAGASPERLAAALPKFQGMERRLTRRGEIDGVTLLDDYAHHPTEIRVTLDAVRERFSPRRLWVIFQPHQTARTRHFMKEFAASFGSAHEIIVNDVYGAREKAVSQKNASEELADVIRGLGGSSRYVPKLEDVAPTVLGRLAEGDVVITVGAGDVWKVADELVDRLSNTDRARRGDLEADVVSPGGQSAVSFSTA